MTIERVRGRGARDQVVDLLSRREPESTWALAILLRPVPRRHSKAWLVRRNGAVVGVLVAARYCYDRWTGVLLLDDRTGAEEMARALDRSGIWYVVGPASALEAVLPRAKRRRGAKTTWLYSVRDSIRDSVRDSAVASRGGGGSGALHQPDGGLQVRPATRADLGELVSLYGLQNDFGVPVWRLRGAVRRALTRTLVADSASGVVGAVMTSPARTYTALNNLVVAPSARGTRVAAALALQAGLAAIAEGKGFCGFRPTPDGSRLVAHALNVSREELTDGTAASRWGGAVLWPPRRFRGHTKLRGVAERLESAVTGPFVGRRRPPRNMSRASR